MSKVIHVDDEVHAFLSRSPDLTPNQVLRYLLGIDDSPKRELAIAEKPRPSLPQAKLLVVDEKWLDDEGRLDLNAAEHELDRQETLFAIENDLDEGISLSEDVFGRGQSRGPGHPWDQGLRIFPKGTMMADLETAALAQSGKLCDKIHPEDERRHCILHVYHSNGHDYEHYHEPKLPPNAMKELTIGEVIDDEDQGLEGV